jgi:hypothetical protein
MRQAAGVMDAARNGILQKYQVAPEAWLSSGMEAEVYAYGSDAVLKLYAGTASLADLRTLQAFYTALDRQHVPYALPRIDTVAEEAGLIITIERRLAGTRLSALLPGLTSSQLDTMMQRYLTAALAVSTVEIPPIWERYKLFDPDRLSERSNGDWHQFLARYLRHKLAEVSPYLSRDVPQLASKVEHLQAILDQPYRGEERLIHGDFFPGNLLVNYEYAITALLDFGLLTMVGDPLFDLATGWVFFDMYDELKAQIRERCLAMLLEQLGEQVRGRLYRYVLIYSILSANTYSPQCSDGHYHWCVANLSNQDYWNAIESASKDQLMLIGAMMRPITFGLVLPVGSPTREGRTTFVADVNRSLSLVAGHFDTAWMIDHLQTDADDMLESFTTISYLAALHPRLVFFHGRRVWKILAYTVHTDSIGMIVTVVGERAQISRTPGANPSEPAGSRSEEQIRSYSVHRRHLLANPTYPADGDHGQ